MRTTGITVYTVDELGTQAKRRAITHEILRLGPHHEELLKAHVTVEVQKALGLPNTRCTMVAKFPDELGDLAAVAFEADITGSLFFNLCQRLDLGPTTPKESERTTFQEEVSAFLVCPLIRGGLDGPIIASANCTGPIMNRIRLLRREVNLRIEQILRRIGKECADELRRQRSDELILENIRAEGFEYLADGSRFTLEEDSNNAEE